MTTKKREQKAKRQYPKRSSILGKSSEEKSQKILKMHNYNYLASFPEMNPNPVAEINTDGSVKYLNPAARKVFPDLEEKGSRHECFVNFKSIVAILKDQKKTSYDREIMVGENWYHQSFFLTPDLGRLRLYSFDITRRKKAEDLLRKSHDDLEKRVQQRTSELVKTGELLERVFSGIDILIAYMDKDFNFLRVNRAYAKADGREPDFYVGKNHFVLFPNEENKNIFKKVVETGEPYSVFAKPFKYAEHPERGVTYWDWSLQPVKEPDGSVGGLVLSLLNVTDLKRAQEAVEAERKRFYDILEVLPAYLVLLTPDHHVAFANRFFRERFGESGGRRCFEYLFGRSEPCETCESYTALKTMAPHRWEWTGPDGRIYDVYDFPFTDTDGSVLILEMGLDITERKRAEEFLQKSEMKYRIVANNTYDWEWWRDPEGNFLYVSPSCKKITNHDPEEFIENPDLLFNIIHPDDKTSFINHQAEIEEKHSTGETEFRVVRPDGSYRWVAHACQPVFDRDGNFLGRRGSNRDITDQKIAEDSLRESEKSLCLLSSQLLTAQEDERKRIARDIHDSIGQTLAAIKFGLESKLSQMGGHAAPPGVSIENIISLTQSGIEECRRIQMDLRPSILDDLGILATLQWFCREFEKIYSTIHIEKQVHLLENDISDQLKTVIYRVIQEAFNNIAKYSQATLVTLTLKKQGGSVKLMIEDNGIGFDLESAQNGFGLGSMRERVKLSGGVFTIESTLGMGTAIKVSWPL